MSDLPFSHLVRRKTDKAGIPFELEFVRRNGSLLLQQWNICDYTAIILSSQAPKGNTWALLFWSNDFYWTYCMNKLIAKTFDLPKTEIHYWTFLPTLFSEGRADIELLAEENYINLNATCIDYNDISSCLTLSTLIPFFHSAHGHNYFTSILSDFVFFQIPKAQKLVLSQFSLIVDLRYVKFTGQYTSATAVLPCSGAIKLISGGDSVVYAVPWKAKFAQGHQVRSYIRKSITWCEKRCHQGSYSKPCPAQVILPPDTGAVSVSIRPQNHDLPYNSYRDPADHLVFDPRITILGCKLRPGVSIDPYVFFNP